MNRTRNTLLAVVATATIASSPTAPPATAAAPLPATVRVTEAVQPTVEVPNLIDATLPSMFISPNGDKVQDRARIPFKLKRKSVVSVKVYRTPDEDSELLFTDKLGTTPRGKHTYRWNGKKPSGRLVRDNGYRVSFSANPVKEGIKKAADYTIVYVDTRYTPEPLEASATTVYPNTTVTTDQIAFNHGGWFWWGGPDSEWVKEVTLVVKDEAGNVVRSAPQTYQRDLFYPVPWDGRDDHGAAVPAGAYQVHMEVTDEAGNQGTSPTIDVNVAAVPLVLASGTRTVPPVTGPLPPAPESAVAAPAYRTHDGRSSTTGGDDYPTQPCGSVFASTIYTPQGASFRSKSNCGWAVNEARASSVLSLSDLNAPRGLRSAQLSMRGRPTADGEVDTARIAFGRQGSGGQNLTATTPAVPGEAVTSTPVLDIAWDATRYHGPTGVEWTIRTIGFDSYDVADVTANFTYLTPQTP